MVSPPSCCLAVSNKPLLSLIARHQALFWLREYIFYIFFPVTQSMRAVPVFAEWLNNLSETDAFVGNFVQKVRLHCFRLLDLFIICSTEENLRSIVLSPMISLCFPRLTN